MQKFVPRRRVGFFRYECTRSTPLDPKHMFWIVSTISVHLGSLGCLTKLGAKHSELVQKFVRRGRFGVFNDERTRSTPLDPNLMFWCVSYHLGPFGCLTKLGAKRAELVQNFVPRSRIGIFRNKRTRSTPLDPKLMFWCVSYRLGAFGIIRLPYETQCKTGRTSGKVCATKSHWKLMFW